MRYKKYVLNLLFLCIGEQCVVEPPANQVSMSCDDHTKSCDQTETQSSELTTKEEPLDMFADSNKVV